MTSGKARDGPTAIFRRAHLDTNMTPFTAVMPGIASQRRALRTKRHTREARTLSRPTPEVPPAPRLPFHWPTPGYHGGCHAGGLTARFVGPLSRGADSRAAIPPPVLSACDIDSNLIHFYKIIV